MLRSRIGWSLPVVVATALLLNIPGCKPADNGGANGDSADNGGAPVNQRVGSQMPSDGAGNQVPPSGNAGQNGADDRPVTPDPPPPPPTVPDVVMSDADRQTCHVFVGDAFPSETPLPDADGNTAAIESLLGEKATVVFLWNEGETPITRLEAMNLLEDMQKEVHEALAEEGVAVLGVHVGETTDEAKQVIADSAVSYPVLFDADRSLFDALATGQLPRIYLLSAEGNVLWLDIEYSAATRSSLQRALEAILSGEGES